MIDIYSGIITLFIYPFSKCPENYNYLQETLSLKNMPNSRGIYKKWCIGLFFLNLIGIYCYSRPILPKLTFKNTYDLRTRSPVVPTIKKPGPSARGLNHQTLNRVSTNRLYSNVFSEVITKSMKL